MPKKTSKQRKTSSKKPRKAKPKVITLKPRQRRYLKKFAKAAHAFGADIKKFAGTLELTPAELSAIEKFPESKDLAHNDKKILSIIIENLLNSMKHFAQIEGALFNFVVPLNEQAGKTLLFVSKSLSNALFAERLILASVHFEIREVYYNYPKMLANFENALKDLINFEKKIHRMSAETKHEFRDIHKELRLLAHEDFFIVSKELMKIYDIRVNAFQKIVAIGRKNKYKGTDRFQKEFSHLAVLGHHYLIMYKNHTQKISQLYKQLIVAKPIGVKHARK